MFPKLKCTLSILLSMSALLVEASIVRRDDALNPGTYRILPVSVPGFQLGITPGKGSSPSLVEVQSPSNNNPDNSQFIVARLGDKFAIELVSGAAVPDNNNRIEVVPGDFSFVPWTIQSVDGRHTITSDNGLGWTVPHGAPVGTPVTLAKANPPENPNQLFDFVLA